MLEVGETPGAFKSEGFSFYDEEETQIIISQSKKCHKRTMKTMETFVFLFPQLNFSAPKEEAYFKILGPKDLPVATMQDSRSR